MQAWLDPFNLPSGKSCLCDFCGVPLQFVLQVIGLLNGGCFDYAFYEDNEWLLYDVDRICMINVWKI